MELDVQLPVIGVVRTAHTGLASTPIQAGLNRAERGSVEIADGYGEGLDGLAEFDYAWLLTWLHKLIEPGSDPPLRQVPFLLRSQQRTMGMFAARGPRRVNPIGLSLIRILACPAQSSGSPASTFWMGHRSSISSHMSPVSTVPQVNRDVAGTTTSQSATA